MFGRKSAHSILSRLAALEARKPGSLVFAVMVDGQARRVSFHEFMEMRKPPRMGEEGIFYDGFPELRIVEGNNLEELDEFLDVFVGGVV